MALQKLYNVQATESNNWITIVWIFRIFFLFNEWIASQDKLCLEIIQLLRWVLWNTSQNFEVVVIKSYVELLLKSKTIYLVPQDILGDTNVNMRELQSSEKYLLNLRFDY